METLTNDNRIRRYSPSPYFTAMRGNRSSCKHFPCSWKSGRPDHLSFDHQPCGAAVSRVPFHPGTSAISRHRGETSGCATLGLSKRKCDWWIALERLDFAIGFLCTSLSKFLFLRQEGTGPPHGCLMFSPRVQVLMYRPALPQQHHNRTAKPSAYCLLPLAQNLLSETK